MEFKRTISANIFFEDLVRRIIYYKRNKDLKNVIKELEQIDSIKNYTDFKKYIISWKQDPSFNSKIHDFGYVGKESLHYGHLEALFHYAGINLKKEDIILPAIEHGINWYETPPESVSSFPRHNYIFQGDYRKKIIHNINPMIPVFCIGPYIHYAEDYYDTDQISELKKSLGKTLLIFPFHTYELSKAHYDEKKFVNDIMTNYAKSFDSVIVCAYWNDVDSSIYEDFESRGAMVVSNGFRDDSNFIKRQKTLIKLSDVTLGNDLGTHIGYSVYLGKPHILISGNTVDIEEKSRELSFEENEIYLKTQKKFLNDFSYNRFLSGYSGTESSQYRKFWGGNSYIKSPQEISEIIRIAQDILLETHGFCKLVDKAIPKLLHKYEESKQDAKFNLLLNSIDCGINELI